MKLTTIKSVVAAALIAGGMTAVAAEPEAIQLWEGGPYFATCNVGATAPEGYGELYKFDNDRAKDAAESLGDGWRLPTWDEFDALTNKCAGQWTTQNGISGYLFSGKDAYTSKSIFLPAAGWDYDGVRCNAGDEGSYWSSDAFGGDNAVYLFFDARSADLCIGGSGSSVRAVRDTPPVAGPTVKVNGVTAGEPWSKITVNYTLSGTDAETYYKVAFDVTAGGQTAGVTNSVAKLTDGAATKELDTTALFGKQVTDTKAKVKVSLIAKNLGGVQLWAGGPIFAKCNIGANAPEEYGYYFWWGDTAGYVRNGSSWDAVDGSKTGFEFSRGNCPTSGQSNSQLKTLGYIDDDANPVLNATHDAATAHLGAPWRMMTDAELQNLTNEVYCTRTWVTSYNGKSVNGYVVKGAQDPYRNNEVFFPAAGCGSGSGLNWEGGLCRYWTSTPDSDNSLCAWGIYFNSSSFRRSEDIRGGGFSVRPVR